MIEYPYPEDWRDLQAGVCRIFKEIGLTAEIAKTIDTPRGRVEIDVYAVDENSVDKIKYIVECKNWKNLIPQSVVHSFTTVMHEVGANIGFIVSREGLQPGAQSYTKNTNIIGLTYEQFQARYFDIWHEKYFITKVGDVVDHLAQYVEPINSYRDKKLDNLPEVQQKRFFELLEKYRLFGMTMAFFEFPRYSKQLSLPLPDSIDKIKKVIQESLGGTAQLDSVYFRDLLHEIVSLVEEVTCEFNDVFGENIFA